MQESHPPLGRSVVYVIDDDPAVRRALSTASQLLDSPVLAFASAEEFLAACDVNQPACLVLDIKMPGQSGLELQRELANRGLSWPIIMISGHADVRIAVEAMSQGAVTLLEKPFRLETLRTHIHRSQAQDRARRLEKKIRNDESAQFAILSEKEREVLRLIVTGKTNKEIARQLHLSVRAVEDRRGRMMRKLNVDSLAELVQLWTRSTAPVAAVSTVAPREADGIGGSRHWLEQEVGQPGPAADSVGADRTGASRPVV